MQQEIITSQEHNHSHQHHHHHHDHGHHHHDHGDACSCGHHHHDHGQGHLSYWRECLSLVLLLAGVALTHFGILTDNLLILLFYILAVLPVAWDIIKETIELWLKGDVMNEFTLMLLASVGAFAIGEYPEAVAILLFYSFGEKMQSTASDDVRRRIRSLIGKLPQHVTVIDEDGTTREAKPEEIKTGTLIAVKPGERVAIDGILVSENPVDLDTSAITGESVPRSYSAGDEVFAGIMPIDSEIRLRTSREFSDSTMSRMMKMIEDASAAKTPTETMLRRITRWFTPTVVILAVAVFVVPFLYSIITDTPFDALMWIHRSLVFFVCSCPCALVVSIPLSYFASLGNAARRGLLFKGATHIDAMRDVDTVVFDKTGTITTGEFSVVDIKGEDPNRVIALAAAIDAHSAHPLAKAVMAYALKNGVEVPEADSALTVPHGMKGSVNGKTVIVGSRKLMETNDIAVPVESDSRSEICVAEDGVFVGSIFLEDTVKPEVRGAIHNLHRLGIKRVYILSGDRKDAVAMVADKVGADKYYPELLPEDKYHKIGHMQRHGHNVAFVGDGINDAPSIAAANIGVAMGTLGTDMAMESADVVIAGDDISKIGEGISLSRKVRRVVMENIAFAFGIKGIVMILAAFGIATLWAGVFADTGVTLVTILWTLLRLKK